MVSNLLSLKDKPIGLTDWAYERIKASVLKLDCPPGTQLEVERLATEMGISRTPVREALLRLARDGLVEVFPRIGFFTTDVTAQDLEELYELREILESRALRDAIPHLSGDDLAYLNKIVEDTRAAIQQKDDAGFLECEILFHAELTQHTPNRRLIATLESFRDLTYRWRIVSIRSAQDMRITYAEHQAINDAVQKRDADLAARLMSEHICKAKARISQIVACFHETQMIPENGRKTKNPIVKSLLSSS
ncbi:MAG: GntR family transcriptional regulator [Chloroflexi bacterium]|nr:GntR family transcriptional regulator [Chloroflexota bacterium]